MAKVVIGIGSNLGDRMSNIHAAIAALRHNGLQISKVSRILKRIALQLGGKITGLVIKVEKKGTLYDILEAKFNDKIVYSKWQDKVDKAENNAKKCAEIIDKEFEHHATYDLKTTENLLRTKGYQFNKDTIFHAWRILVEEGKAKEVDKETWYLKP